MYQRYVHQLNLPFNVVKTMLKIKEHTREHLLGIAAKSEIAGILYYTVKIIIHLLLIAILFINLLVVFFNIKIFNL
jgi:hypothetical protein